MIIITTYITTCVEAIKPRQIINYDAGIVLIDLHQLNGKNNYRPIQISGTEYEDNLMSTKNRTRRTATATSAFPSKMIEQINIALEQNWSGRISQPGSLK